MPPYRWTRDASAYFRHPSDAYLLRRRFLCASPGYEIFTLFAWGKLGVDDARELVEVLDESVRSGPPTRRQLVVLREVESVSLEALAVLVAYYAGHPGYLKTVSREAVVRPDGIVGIMAEGFYPAVPMAFPHAVFRSAQAALEWVRPTLAAETKGLTAWLERTEDLVRSHRAETLQDLVDLRDSVVRLGARASIQEVARDMRTSRRTLQRRLADAETSFRRERDRIITAIAMERLSDPERRIKEVAVELGFATNARFCEHFRRCAGTTPSLWREQHRRASMGEPSA